MGALSMQVLGNLKSVFTAVCCVLIFKNDVTAQGVFGYSVTMAGEEVARSLAWEAASHTHSTAQHSTSFGHLIL